MEKQDWLEANRPDVWRDVIKETHASLFDPDYLFEMGDIYRREFAGERFDNPEDGSGKQSVTIPVIPLSACRFPQAPKICTVRSGFDLPLLITPKENWNREVVAFVSQDPLRKESHWPHGLSMSTPWGFSAHNVTSPGGKKVWPAVEWLCRNGYGVYFTDVWKLYVDPGAGVTRNDITKKAEHDVFRCEVSQLKPKLLITFGNAAFYAMSGTGLPPIDRHPHPTAYGALKRHYGTPDEKFSTIQNAIIEQIASKLL
ncbi:hypothetical protein [Ruegeria arenilitoris]|uniref:hypothetical protein n=1 Tax=Ruegeria arenilitoris TaxID=1173585 RepID=UPI00147DD6C9|nr:hypothetical protein [Ruegeria arenilitoris]